ncbi:hypothetical protein WAF17_03270 [Bernardetia sp. ABR2-2B]|uniref:hypothetical protein n=1 Tax=Bernardetia sp. ABR2-2B TaxID=3127472 RepID=UPI0030CD442B
MIHSHRLTSRNKKHKSFLEEERNDPITGDKIIEGNEIVICEACKSAFLLDSWNYMAHSHCNQPFTLKEIPIKQRIVREIEVKKEEEYKFKIAANSNIILVIIVSVLIQFLSIKPIVFLLINKMITMFWIFLSFITLTPIIYHYFQSNKRLKISSFELVISSFLNKKFFFLSKIEELEFFYSSNDKKNVSTIMFLMNGKIKRFRIKKERNTISEIKQLQEYFEENNLSNKISVFLEE